MDGTAKNEKCETCNTVAGLQEDCSQSGPACSQSSSNLGQITHLADDTGKNRRAWPAARVLGRYISDALLEARGGPAHARRALGRGDAISSVGRPTWGPPNSEGRVGVATQGHAQTRGRWAATVVLQKHGMKAWRATIDVLGMTWLACATEPRDGSPTARVLEAVQRNRRLPAHCKSRPISAAANGPEPRATHRYHAVTRTRTV